MPPAKVLVVERDAASQARLEAALTEAGYTVALAPSASFAATMLEWERPDLIVSGAHVEDMKGDEFFSLVRKDPLTSQTPFLLLAGSDRPLGLVARELGVDLVLMGDYTTDAVVERVRALLNGERPTEAGESSTAQAGKPRSLASLWEAIEAAGSVPMEVSKDTFQGSLGVMGLAEVTQAIALGGKTGCLIVSLDGGQGAVLFESGRVVHAGFRTLTGEQAFAALVVATRQDADARFTFNRADHAQLVFLPRTISVSVDQLLLHIATGIDYARTSFQPANLAGSSVQRKGV